MVGSKNSPFMNRWEPVIGLEIHCQLSTDTKLFCGCETSFGSLPNHQTCPVCLGMPGVLPVLNRRAVDYGIKMALAVGSEVQEVSVFARKQYFYPDLPKNYQITQFDLPFCTGGGIRLNSGRTIRLVRIHLEEDAGKNIHEGRHSFIDLNRAGTPLIEIVSEPDIRSPQEAAEYLKKVRDIVRYLEISDGNLEEGSFRCDANVSVRPRGREELGTRCEIKNLNSFRNIEKAVTYEIIRQADLLDEGEEVHQKTLLWDPAAGKTRVMRSKGDGEDYRYFADPDLPPLIISASRTEAIRKKLPELPHEKAARYQSEFGVTPEDSTRLTSERELAQFFEKTLELTGGKVSGQQVSNWICTEYLRSEGPEESRGNCTEKQLADLLLLLADGTISGKIAKKVYALMTESGKSPGVIVKEQNLVQITDIAAVEKIVREVIESHPEQVKELQSGKDKVRGFLVGQIMKSGNGKLNPGLVQKCLGEFLNERKNR